MTWIWFGVGAVCAGLVIYQFTRIRRLRWLRKIFLEACCATAAVLMALGHGDRQDAVWPVLVGVLILSQRDT